MKDQHPPSSRILQLQGDMNFRDFGGYLTADGSEMKRGKLFRSATLSRLDDEDIPAVDAIGLNRILDLRTKREIDREGYDKIYHSNEAKYDFLDFGYGDPYLMSAQVESELQWDMRQVDFPSIYINMMEQNKGAIKQAFDRFADPVQYPNLIHCTQGKDRTGIIVALLLLMLNISKTVVMEDYMLTEQLIDREARMKEMESHLSLMKGIVPRGVSVADWAPFFKCLPDSMERLFTYLQKEYNGVTRFLNSIGVDEDQQRHIQGILVEKGS